MTEFHEGARIVIPGNTNPATQDVFATTLIASMALRGKPVRCNGIVPGVTMLIRSGGMPPHAGDEAEWMATEVWEQIAPKLTDWLTMPAPPAAMTMQLADVSINLGWDTRSIVSPGAMDVVVTHEPAAVALYWRQRRRQPLVDRPPNEDEIAVRRSLEIKRRLIDAVQKTRETTAPRLARLPGLVRYRVTGAMSAWHALREAVDPISSPPLTDSLKTVRIPRLMKHLEMLARDALPDGAQGYSADHFATAALYSAVWMAFELRGGAFYEPTPPLHRLLDAAYIADDVQIGMLALPVDTLCIIPEPCRWAQHDEVEAIAIFRNARSIGFVIWTQSVDGHEGLYIDALELSVDDPEKTIRELIDDEFRDPNPEDQDARQLWRNALDYAIKMLLYLKARDAQVTHDRAYSNAPRDFSGLGKRRRAERVAEIETLYDRHIVGPAILDAELVASLPGDGSSQREVRGHWRRPHFKMQPHGPNSSLRKLVFIGPTIVRPDRLGL